MAKQRIILPPDAKRGTKMPTGKGWRLVTPSKNRAFKASLLKRLNVGGERLAIFREV
jgi:hypothetical protein